MAVQFVVRAIEDDLQDGPGDDFIHLWTRRVYRTSGNPDDGYAYVIQRDIGTDSHRKTLHLPDDISLWAIVHEMAHILDVPSPLCEAFNNADDDPSHGGFFRAYLDALADAIEQTVLGEIAAIGSVVPERVMLPLLAAYIQAHPDTDAAQLTKIIKARTDQET